MKQCDCDIFIVVHHHQHDKIYSYTSSETNFSIDRVSKLILKEMQSAAFLNKNKKFEEVNFPELKADIEKINEL